MLIAKISDLRLRGFGVFDGLQPNIRHRHLQQGLTRQNNLRNDALGISMLACLNR